MKRIYFEDFAEIGRIQGIYLIRYFIHDFQKGNKFLDVTLIKDYSNREEVPGGFIVPELRESSKAWYWNFYDSSDWTRRSGGRVKSYILTIALPESSWKVNGEYYLLRRDGKKVSFEYTCLPDTLAARAYSLVFDTDQDAENFEKAVIACRGK